MRHRPLSVVMGFSHNQNGITKHSKALNWSGKEDSNLRPLPPEDASPLGIRRFSVVRGAVCLSRNDVCSWLVSGLGSLRALGPCLARGWRV